MEAKKAVTDDFPLDQPLPKETWVVDSPATLRWDQANLLVPTIILPKEHYDDYVRCCGVPGAEMVFITFPKAAPYPRGKAV